MIELIIYLFVFGLSGLGLLILWFDWIRERERERERGWVDADKRAFIELLKRKVEKVKNASSKFRS